MDREFRFIKYHGCGNDFLLTDEQDGLATPDPVRSAIARRLCDRHFQVGADGVIFLERAWDADGSMRLFEPAGNEADMCGNGIRCVAAYLSEKLGKDSLDILTRDGVKQVVRLWEQFRVCLGPVRTQRRDLRPYLADPGSDTDSLLDFRALAGGQVLRGSLVNSGEPHFVLPVPGLDSLDVPRLGGLVNEDRKRFPGGVNVNFVEVESPSRLRIRTYERGVYDETLACGTGATASAAVALIKGWVQPGPILVSPPGGTLRVDIAEDGSAYLTGPAVPVFEGRIRLPL